MMPIIDGVPGAVSDSFNDYSSVYALYSAAFDLGHVQWIVKVGSIYDNDSPSPAQRRHSASSETDLWESMSDINDAAGQWMG